jgi:hypothetical protein
MGGISRPCSLFGMQGMAPTANVAAGAPDRGAGVNETTGVLAMAVLFGAPLSLALSLVLVALYRRAVHREMKRSAPGSAGGAPVTPPNPVPLVHEAARSWRVVRRRAGAAYVAGGLAYAVTASVLYLWLGELEALPFRTLLIVTAQFWPFVILLVLFFVSSLASRVVLFASYFSVLSLPAVVADHWYDPFVFWGVMEGVPTLLFVGFLWYRVRAVGPLSLAVVLSLIVGANAGMFWLAAHAPEAAGIGAAVGATALVVVGVVVAAGAVPVVAVVVWLLRGLGRLYRDGRIGDQELTAETLVFTFALLFTSDVVFSGRHGAYFFVGLLPFAVFVVVSRLLRPPAARSRQTPSLLFLRVFAPPGSAARLWSVLGRSWRYHGSVNLIGGPDLALSTLAPHRFLDFLGGRLAARFVHDKPSFDQALSRFETGRDRDGRFAVNELYCGDTAWRSAFEALVPQSQVILMDLRGFTRARDGASFELAALAGTGSLSRAVLLVDRTTDRGFMEEIIAQASLAARGRGRILDVSSDFSEASLMNALQPA